MPFARWSRARLKINSLLRVGLSREGSGARFVRQLTCDGGKDVRIRLVQIPEGQDLRGGAAIAGATDSPRGLKLYEPVAEASIQL